MRSEHIRGVVAAIPTPFDGNGAPDLVRFVALAEHLLANGCDGLNVLGTTGEATSLSVEERTSVMKAAAARLPLSRLIVGTGAASVTDAVNLTRQAADLRFAGALLLPPFYYKGVSGEGVLAYLRAIVDATAESAIPIYLYHFPALSGVPWTLDIIREALEQFPGRIAGVKDSSSDLPFCRQLAELNAGLSVFPSTEAVLLDARAGAFAGCISASANVNADLCRRAFHGGDAAALAQAVAIRDLFRNMNIVSGVKGLLAAMRSDGGFARTRPPLQSLTGEEQAALTARATKIRNAS